MIIDRPRCVRAAFAGSGTAFDGAEMTREADLCGFLIYLAFLESGRRHFSTKTIDNGELHTVNVP